MKKSSLTIAAAMLLTITVLVSGYTMLGLLPMFLFAFGFVGGFILWLLVPVHASFEKISLPFYLTLCCFVLHKIEERYMDFFPRLSEITGVPVPETGSVLIYLLYASAGAWLFIPYLVKRGHSFGYYLAWTFFTSMGVTELAHFFFPFFTGKAYSYFPGMATAAILVPSAWWGIYRLSLKRN